MTTTEKRRLRVSDWTTLKFGDRDVQAQVVNVHRGWILARVNDDEIPYGYVIVRESNT